MTLRDDKGRFLAGGERDARGRFVKAEPPGERYIYEPKFSEHKLVHDWRDYRIDALVVQDDEYDPRIIKPKPWYRRLNDWLKGRA